MLSDEEKKAIEKIKKIVYMFPESEELKLLLNLIEKQSKKIEELKYDKKFYQEVIDEVNETWKDKIKAKIEEIKNDCRKCRFKGEICEELNQNNQCVQGECIKVLQSLLEKED